MYLDVWIAQAAGVDGFVFLSFFRLFFSNATRIFFHHLVLYIFFLVAEDLVFLSSHRKCSSVVQTKQYVFPSFFRLFSSGTKPRHCFPKIVIVNEVTRYYFSIRVYY